jgi:asparagine synthase (glutamine-hydrolysing)
MCGFACLIQPGRSFAQGLLNQLDADLFHRGPDSGGQFAEPGAAMVFRRLSIMDPTPVSDQPMNDPQRDVTLVFNGEIYNYQALRDELIQAGARFKTKGDTEVVLQGYAHWGRGVFERLEGMYAIGILDRREGRFLAARDPLGIKPLYLLHSGDLTAVASEVRPLTRLVRAEIDSEAVPELLTFNWAAGRRSNYKGIDLLPGGTLVDVDLRSGAMTERRFCDPLDTLSAPRTVGAEEAQAGVVTSLKSHLMSDVGYAMQLSGGLDSSLLTALAADTEDRRLASFACKIDDAELDEGRYRQTVVDAFNLDHHEDPIDGSRYADLLPDAISAMEGPTPHGGCVALFALCKSLGQSHKVVLTGEGADEMFGGYLRYALSGKLAQHEKLDRALPDFLPTPDVWPFRSVRRLRGRDRAAYASVYGDFGWLQHLFPDILPAAPGPREAVSDRFDDFRDRLFAVDQTAYLSSLLVRQDKLSMASSVEARVPFVHMPLLRLVNAMPHDVRAPGGVTKPVLKALADKYLGAELVHRRKVGLLLPYDRWMRDEKALGRYLDLLAEPTAEIRGFADSKRLDRALQDARTGQMGDLSDFFKLINLELWMRSTRSDTRHPDASAR